MKNSMIAGTVLLLSLSARAMPELKIKGVVKKFDKQVVELYLEGKNVELPRQSISSKSLKIGGDVTANLSLTQFAGLQLKK